MAGGTDVGASMMLRGVVRVLQYRLQAGKGPLPLASLAGEFLALWKVPFALQMIGERDAASFLRRSPDMVTLSGDGEDMVVSLVLPGR